MCELCKAKVIKIEVTTEKPDNAYYFHSDPAVGLMFCPMCGEPLTQPEPLSLERLKQMCKPEPNKVYDPVWIKTISDNKISCVISSKLLHGDHRYKTPRYWADAHRVNLALEDYGKTWLAYTRKPRQEP